MIACAPCDHDSCHKPQRTSPGAIVTQSETTVRAQTQAAIADMALTRVEWGGGQIWVEQTHIRERRDDEHEIGAQQMNQERT